MVDVDPVEVEEGHRRLAISMLRQTAIDLLGNDGNSVEAQLWLDRDEEDMPGFVWCCHILGLRHTIVRDALFTYPTSIAQRLSRLVEARHKRGEA